MPRHAGILIVALAVMCTGAPAHADPRRPAAHPPAAAALARKRPAHKHVAPARAHKHVAPSRARRHRRVPRGYAAQVRRWHRHDPDRKPPLDAQGKPKLVLDVLNTREQVELEAASADGGFTALALERAAHALRDQQSGNEFPVDPGVLALLYRLQTHFHAASVRVVSAYRSARPGSRSRHGQGRAVDVIVPGAPDRLVARLVRALGFCGVGVYLVSGFVHVDVRARSYFWLDSSGPGQPSRARPVLGNVARRADAHALAEGCPRPRATVLPRGDVDAVFRDEFAGSRDAASARPGAEDDDSEDDSGAGGG